MDSSSCTIQQKANQAKEEPLRSDVLITNHMLSFINSMSLKCALELRIFDTIHNYGRPMSPSHLGRILSLPSQKAKFLPQLMRFLAYLGYFFTSTNIHDHHHGHLNNEEEEGQNYSLTPTALLLLENHPFTKRSQVLFTLNPDLQRPWHLLSEWFKSDQPNLHDPFTFANNGTPIWAHGNREMEFSATLNEAMASDSRLIASILLDNNDSLCTKSGKPKGFFNGLRSLVDVGGGTGELARAIAKTHPNMKCIVLDLFQVVGGLKGTHNLSFVAGNMFESIPPTDAILLKWILHNWNNVDSVKILKQCRKAIKTNENSSEQGKVMIIDIVLMDGEQRVDHKVKETQLLYDMEMMVLFATKERSEKEWKKLFEDAGFSGGYKIDAGFSGGYKIYPLRGLKSLIEVYP